MNVCASNLKRVERVLFFAGLALLGFAAIAFVGGRVYSHWAIARFHAPSTSQPGAGGNESKIGKLADFSLWSPKRIKAYEATLTLHFDEPLALLRVDKIHLEVPVFEGTNELILNRGVGRIAGTARVDESGNVGLAGHRDGFFRGLKDIAVGDALELETHAGTRTYVVDSIKVVDPQDVSVLKNESKSALTLVTCFPFYFVGSAPQRFVLHASLRSETKTPNALQKATLHATASGIKESTQ